MDRSKTGFWVGSIGVLIFIPAWLLARAIPEQFLPAWYVLMGACACMCAYAAVNGRPLFWIPTVLASLILFGKLLAI